MEPQLRTLLDNFAASAGKLEKLQASMERRFSEAIAALNAIADAIDARQCSLVDAATVRELVIVAMNGADDPAAAAAAAFDSIERDLADRVCPLVDVTPLRDTISTLATTSADKIGILQAQHLDLAEWSAEAAGYI